MSDLFIPPEGAMQFEVTLGPQREVISLSLWVGQSIPYLCQRMLPECKCDIGWPVIHLIDPSHPALLSRASNWNRGLRDRRPVMVCKCIGRLVE